MAENHAVSGSRAWADGKQRMECRAGLQVASYVAILSRNSKMTKIQVRFPEFDSLVPYNRDRALRIYLS